MNSCLAQSIRHNQLLQLKEKSTLESVIKALEPAFDLLFLILNLFVVEEWCLQWHVLLDSLELSEVVCMRNLLSLSNADQVCGIVASVMMARAPPSVPPQEGTAHNVGHRMVVEVCGLLLSDTERVRVCAGLALYCLNMHTEKVQLLEC